MNKSTPITSRIQKRSIGGIVQPAIEGMGSVAKMDNKIIQKNGKDTNRRGDGSLVMREDTAQSKSKPSPNKMYDSPAKNYKEGYYNSPAKEVGDGETPQQKYMRNLRETRNKAYSKKMQNTTAKPLFADEAQGKEFYRKRHLGRYFTPAEPVKDYTGEGPTVDKINNKPETKQEFAGRTPYTIEKTTTTNFPYKSKESTRGVIHGPKDSYKAAYKNRDMKIYGNMDLDQYTKEAKRQTKSFETTGKFDAPKKARKKVSKVTSLKPEGVKNMSIENIAAPGIKAEKLVAKAPKTAKQTRKSNSIDKKLAKAKTARASGNIKKAERKEKRAANKQERIAKRSRTRSENTAIKGKKAVVEGRDRKSNRLLNRAANQENREIKREDRKAARVDRKAAKGKMTMTKSKVDKKPKSSKKKVLDSSRVPM